MRLSSFSRFELSFVFPATAAAAAAAAVVVVVVVGC